MKSENMKLENVYINGDIDRVEIYFHLPISSGICISNIINLSIFIDRQEIEPSNIWLRKADLEIPYIYLSLLKYEYIDPKETITIIINNHIGLSQAYHKVEIQTTYLEYSDSSENKYRQINKYQSFSCMASNKYINTLTAAL